MSSFFRAPPGRRTSSVYQIVIKIGTSTLILDKFAKFGTLKSKCISYGHEYIFIFVIYFARDKKHWDRLHFCSMCESDYR